MSTVGLEFSSFINPSLTWKTVSKGRSTLRRSRRPVSRNSQMGHEQNKSLKKVESQGSESGKTTSITRRFNDSMENIPIKKRRFLFRSPSPPPQYPHNESGELASCISDQPGPQQVEIDSSNVKTLVQDACDSGIDGKILKTTDEVHGCGDDFSGIAILAAAACIDIPDKPSANTMRSAIDESVTTQQNKSLEVHNTVEDSLPASADAACQISEGTKTFSAPRDDRLHWDLNTPMDEWDHPLDDTVNSAMKLETTTVDCLVNKEHTPQPSIGGVDKSEALTDMKNNVSGAELAQCNNSQTGKQGAITGEALLDLMHNDSGLHLSVQECGAGPSSCMKVGIKYSSDISHVKVVDRVETVDHCLCLGSNDTKTSLSEGKSMAAVNDLQDVAKEGSASAMQVDDTEKSKMDSSQKTVPVEAKYEIDDASCQVMKNLTKTMESDDNGDDLQELPFHPFQCHPIPPEKQELDLSHVRSPEDTQVDEGINNIPHFKDTKDPGETPKFNEVESEVSNACDQLSEASLPDAKKCESESMQAPKSKEQSCNIHNSNCEGMVEPEKKNDLDGNSSDLDDFCRPGEPYAVGSESAFRELKDVCISSFPSKSRDMSASMSVDDGPSAKSAPGMERKDESGIGVGNEGLVHMKMENTYIVNEVDNQVGPSNHLHASHEDCSQVVTSGLEGGYDSYLEDGELRESIEHCWVDNDVKNRESEIVDYDCDNRDECEFTDAANGPIAEKVVTEVVLQKQSNQLHEHLQCEDGLPAVEKSMEEDNSCPRHDSFLAEGDAGIDCLKANPSTSKSIFVDHLSSMDNPEVVDMDVDDGRKSSIVSRDLKEDENDGFEDISDLYVKGPGMKDSRRELQSRIEGPSDRRVTYTALRSRYRNFKHSYYRDERQIGVDESLGRRRSMHTDYGGRVGSRYWNHGLRSVVANPSYEGNDEKLFEPTDDTSPGAHRHGMFCASRGRYIRPVRTGSPSGRAEDYGMGLVKVRDVTSESSQRNRYDRHLSGMSREGYGRPVHEAPNSSHSMANHFIKREARSRSRSRTRSPDLRPDGRMGRARMQYQTADHFRERRSPLRGFCQGQKFDTTSGRLRSGGRPVTRPVRFVDAPPSGRAHEYENDDDYRRKTYLPRSRRRSQSGSRSCSPEFRSEARMGTMRLPYLPTTHTGDHMTDRRSPQRMFRPGKRFDTMGSPGRLRSGDCLRPVPRPVRFQNAAQPSSSRGNEYEGDDYRRKSRTIFDRIHPRRSYDMESDDRQFDYDAEEGIATQSFHRNDVYTRGASRRPVDLVRGAREERSNTRFNSDRMYSTGPKPFGIREYSDDALPRRLRPE